MLVTGFGPFRGVEDNPSARLARDLDPEATILPVEWRAVADFLLRRQEATILLLGVATSRAEPTYELFAHNAAGAEPDAAGRVHPLREIAPGAPRTLGATLLSPSQLPGLAMRPSFSPGDYLCNYALYLALLRSGARRVGFVHVAPFERCPREDQLEALRALVARIRAAPDSASSSADAAMNSSIAISSPSGHISNGPSSRDALDATRHDPAITVPSQTPR